MTLRHSPSFSNGEEKPKKPLHTPKGGDEVIPPPGKPVFQRIAMETPAELNARAHNLQKTNPIGEL